MHNEIKVIAPPGYRAVQNDDGTVTFEVAPPYEAPHAAVSGDRGTWLYESYGYVGPGKNDWGSQEKIGTRPVEGPTVRNVRWAEYVTVRFAGTSREEVAEAAERLKQDIKNNLY